MANTFFANGFSQYQGTGSSPTYEITTLSIASTNTTPIFSGDPVSQAASSTGVGTGYITQATAPVALTISGGVLTAGVMVITFTATASAIPIGTWITLYGFTSTAATLNGSYQVTASTTTTASFNFSGAFTTGSGTGYAFVPVAGVFLGCRYYSIAQKKPFWSNYWPGTTDASGDVQAFVVTDPNAQFIVGTGNSNTTSSAVGLANVGQNISYNYVLNGASPATVNGNTSNGISTYFADQYSLAANFPSGYAANSFLPFRILGLANYVPGTTSPLASINGNDNTTAYNRIIVGFNNSMPRGFAGI